LTTQPVQPFRPPHAPASRVAERIDVLRQRERVCGPAENAARPLLTNAGMRAWMLLALVTFAGCGEEATSLEVDGGEDEGADGGVDASPPGIVDTTFGTDGYALGGDRTWLADMVVQPDGRIVVVGSTREAPAASSTQTLVGRFTADGAPDESFGIDGWVVISSPDLEDDYVHGAGVGLAPDGTIVVLATKVPNFGGREDALIVRLDQDGNAAGEPVLLEGGGTWTEMAVDGQGRIVLGHGFYSGMPAEIGRLLPDGTWDESFGTDGIASASSLRKFNAMALDGDRVVAIGSVGEQSQTSYVVVRFSADGQLDGSFGDSGVRELPDGVWPGKLAIQPSGSVTINGGCQSSCVAVRLTAEGDLDASFGEDGIAEAAAGANVGNVPPIFDALAITSDGGVRVIARTHLVRFSPDGAGEPDAIPIPTPIVGAPNFAGTVAVATPDGLIVGGTTFETAQGDRLFVVRLDD
jgi:uncharacterized delta-60 repeat protein